jgi:hypothetical protein
VGWLSGSWPSVAPRYPGFGSCSGGNSGRCNGAPARRRPSDPPRRRGHHSAALINAPSR